MPKSFGRFNKILFPDACRTHPPRGELPWLLPELWGIQPRKPHSRTQKTRTVSAHLSAPTQKLPVLQISAREEKRAQPTEPGTAVIIRDYRSGESQRVQAPSWCPRPCSHPFPPSASKMERRLRVRRAQIVLRLAPRPTARRRRRGKGGAGEGRFSVHAFAWEAAPRRRGSLWAAPAPLT